MLEPLPATPPGKKKSRNRLMKELDDQARARKKEQQQWNYANPPQDDIYICAFCEFENINGYKPLTLIRAFEMKERKKRLEAERRQRLLEKAKARGRKGRKGKPPAKGTAADSQPPAATPTGQQGPPMQANQSQETRSDNCTAEEEYADDGEGSGAADAHHEHDKKDGGGVPAASVAPAGPVSGGGNAEGRAEAARPQTL